MRDSTIDTVDYVVTVAAMNWIVNALWDEHDIQTTVAQADRTGQDICRHYVAGEAATYQREIDPITYRWRPVYEVILEPAVRLMLDPAKNPVDRDAARGRLEQLERCVRHLLVMCERSPEWDGSNAERFMSKLHETLVPALQRLGAELDQASRPEPWSRDLIAPTNPVAGIVGDDLTPGRSDR
jgi:hypothetical protein